MIYIGSPNGEKLFKNLIQNYRAELRSNSHGLILATGGTQEIWEIIFLFEKDFVTLQANNNHEDRTMDQEVRWLTNYKKVWEEPVETSCRGL